MKAFKNIFNHEDFVMSHRSLNAIKTKLGQIENPILWQSRLTKIRGLFIQFHALKI